MSLRLKGILLFLFIPLVLFMFVYYPFGILASFIPAIAVMFGHRFVAEPFMEGSLDKRCLFCGKDLKGLADNVAVDLKSGIRTFRACSPDHGIEIRRFTGFVIEHRRILAAGIFIPLVYYLVAMLAVGISFDIKFASAENFIRFNKIVFKGVIAITVVLVSFLYKRGRVEPGGKFPFPIHNLALLGIGPTLWVFRIVGIVWILQSLYAIYKL